MAPKGGIDASEQFEAGLVDFFTESLILAQNERWRRG